MYQSVVSAIVSGLVMKRVHNAADIVAMSTEIQRVVSYKKHSKFELLIILHQLWTPSRMKYFIDRYNTGNSLVDSIIDADSAPTISTHFEDVNLRAGLIKGQTNEAAITRIVTTNYSLFHEVALDLEKNWSCTDVKQKIKIVKKIPFFGNYHAAHLIRSLSYILNSSMSDMSWLELASMSQGVKFITGELGELRLENPHVFSQRLGEDVQENLTVGDIAIIFCEMHSAKTYNIHEIHLTREKASLLRDAVHNIHQISHRNTTMCYVSARKLLRYMNDFQLQ
tara:strand:- start:1006 stop:1848 length:843 start_codon:yes stop_codon:yes gene_type:complete